MRKTATVFASISACTWVFIGALGAHGLGKIATDNNTASGMISNVSLHGYETAAHYQLLHAIALLAVVALPVTLTKYFKAIAYLFMLGVVLFSGSIYILVLGDYLKVDLKSVAGPITPIGGLCLIIAWFMLILSALKYKDITNNEQKL